MKLNLNNVNLKISAGTLGQIPREPIPNFAFSGRSNVGKSSLINTLLGRKSMARVSGSPGKTITINFYDIDKKLYFADLPGYGYAKRGGADIRRWSDLVQGYFSSEAAMKNLSAVIQLVDLKVGPTADDEMMLDWLNQTKTPYFIVATKSDKLSKTAAAEAIDAISAHPLVAKGTVVIPFSSLNRTGKDEVWREIYKYC